MYFIKICEKTRIQIFQKPREYYKTIYGVTDKLYYNTVSPVNSKNLIIKIDALNF